MFTCRRATCIRKPVLQPPLGKISISMCRCKLHMGSTSSSLKCVSGTLPHNATGGGLSFVLRDSLAPASKRTQFLMSYRASSPMCNSVAVFSSSQPTMWLFRGNFITAHEARDIWDGDFAERGMMMYLVSGRGALAGALLPRFYEVDWTKLCLTAIKVL